MLFQCFSKRMEGTKQRGKKEGPRGEKGRGRGAGGEGRREPKENRNRPEHISPAQLRSKQALVALQPHAAEEATANNWPAAQPLHRFAYMYMHQSERAMKDSGTRLPGLEFM